MMNLDDIKEIVYLERVNRILQSSIKSLTHKHLCTWDLREQIQENNNRIQEIVDLLEDKYNSLD